MVAVLQYPADPQTMQYEDDILRMPWLGPLYNTMLEASIGDSDAMDMLYEVEDMIRSVFACFGDDLLLAGREFKHTLDAER